MGQGGGDKLLGGVGNDIIWVYLNDADIAMGGSGSETFVFDLNTSEAPSAVASQILDFRVNEDYLRFES